MERWRITAKHVVIPKGISPSASEFAHDHHAVSAADACFSAPVGLHRAAPFLALQHHKVTHAALSQKVLNDDDAVLTAYYNRCSKGRHQRKCPKMRGWVVIADC